MDSIWQAIRNEVKQESDDERLLTSFFYSTVLNHDRLEDALSFHLAEKLKSIMLPAMSLREAIDEALRRSPEIGDAARADLVAVRERDPACTGYWVPLLYFKGFHALQAYRVAHWLWAEGRRALALHFQNRISELFGVDIHPARSGGQGDLHRPRHQRRHR